MGHFMSLMIPILCVVGCFSYLIVKSFNTSKVDAEKFGRMTPEQIHEVMMRNEPVRHGRLRPGLAVGLMLAGVGLGLLLTFVLDAAVGATNAIFHRAIPGVCFGLVLLCSGMGLFTAYLLSRKFDKEERGY